MDTIQRQSSFLWEGSTLEIHLPAVLTASETGKDWTAFINILKTNPPRSVIVQANNLGESDTSGISFIKLIRLECEGRKIPFVLRGLGDQFKYRLSIADDDSKKNKETLANSLRRSEKIGKLTIDSLLEFKYLVTFTGELTVSFWRSFLHPSKIRWKDTFRVAESMGVNAFPIIAMIGFLLGLIMSFQSAIPMRRFGAEIFVANLVGLSLFRELGPLMTAFILSGRSGSAFAAELGTMKVSEEIDALTTMGLPPVQFLIIPRLVASLFMTPLLTIVFNLFGLIGGAVVLISFGFPLITFINQVNIAVGLSDILGGLLKSYFFGMIIASIGCYRGLKTASGAGAVGESTTSAVVGSIILVSILDGIFSVLYFYLKI
ncbi:ABC transporter permease [Leptospira sp. 2 VSF19]|uniref:ABC transporter permease n=1 Tax=Leptospira soteropolitanensis TaxID=2950025 RepID=A0AAW5VFV9_9LEPT|nr:ABC transporter permease [Leptospira soteropolitanensis]MCW7494266.1 ABC transporter permease [Leptospira soteropolitanensis]MCW7501759.1 ABC transporter permease [Leptospira soteropolitanensis]MCW7524112.1 ABC transporter permease [Leptospira soteropolitanensis]MCW7527977.1 ABC transporter permease [Leptospira soteropolitanensis]MCW7531729.1 ABC transporter permease [Leptospira soteropolitanensis]